MKNKKTALITGATGGIGKQLVAQLTQQNYDLWLIDKEQTMLTEVQQNHPNTYIQQVDLSVSKQVQNLCKDIAQLSDTIDVAFVNAGIVIPKLVVENQTQDIDLQLDINLKSALHLIHALTQKMLKQGHGNIIVTVSMGGIIALERSALYSASKFGLRGFILALQQELRGSKVHLSALYASGIDTPMLRYEAKNNGNSLNFLATPLQPEKVAKTMIDAIKTGKESIYLPYIDSLTSRLLGAFPWLIYPISPILKYFGEKGRKRYLKTLDKSK